MTHFKRYILLCCFFISMMYASVDTTQVIDFEQTNFEEVMNFSDWQYIPYQEWSFSGGLMNNGLPQYALNFLYNDFDARDPLYGNQVHAWINPRTSQIFIKNNTLNQKPYHNYKKDLYSRFDWYRGDYYYGILGGVLSGVINDEYAYTFYGDDFRYAGGSGAFTSDQSDMSKSISQNFAMDVIKSNDKYDLEVGFNYRKYFAGNIGFSNDEIQSPFIDGYSKKFHKQMYLKYVKKNSTSQSTFGGQMSNFNYGYYPKDDDNNLKGQGITNSIFYKYDKYFTSDTLDAAVKLNNSAVFIESENEINNQIVSISCGLKGKRLGFDYHFNGGMKNDKLHINGSVEKTLTDRLKLGLSLNHDYFTYPFIYQIYNETTDFAVKDNELQNYKMNSGYFSYATKYLKIKSSVNYTKSEFYRPTITAAEDSVINFTKINLDDIFWNTQLSISTPWRTSLFGNVKYSPTVDENSFYWLQFYGHIEQKLTLFKGNLNLYVRGSLSYSMGGEDLYWYDEFQNTGMIDNDYYTNEPLCFSMKAGFKVGSLHMFYQMHNLESRSFSNMQGMLLQTPLNILGIEWYFNN